MDWEAVVGAGRLELVDLGDDVELLQQRDVVSAISCIQVGRDSVDRGSYSQNQKSKVRVIIIIGVTD